MSHRKAICFVGKKVFRDDELLDDDNNSSPRSVLHYDVFIYDGSRNYSVGYGVAGNSYDRISTAKVKEMDLNEFKQDHEIIGEPLLFLDEDLEAKELEAFVEHWKLQNHNTRINGHKFSKDFVRHFCGVEIHTQNQMRQGLLLFGAVVLTTLAFVYTSPVFTVL